MKVRHLTALAAVLLIAALPCTVLADDAAAAFKSKCTPCHGQDGSGNTPMGKKNGAKDLASAEVQKKSDAELQKTISDGKAKMPSFSAKLTADQISGLVKFIRTLAAK